MSFDAKVYVVRMTTKYFSKFGTLPMYSTESVNSYTLARAITYAISILHPEEIPWFIDQLKNDNVRISSFFPLIDLNSESQIYLIPIPLFIKIYLAENIERGSRKAFGVIKRLRWISIDALRTILGILGRTHPVGYVETDGEERLVVLDENISFVVSGSILHTDRISISLTEIEPNKIIHTHNIIDRISSATDIYHLEYLYFRTKLYFVVASKNQKIMNRVHSAIKLLGELGLGSKRTVGSGRFQVLEIHGADEPIVKFFGDQINCQGTHWVALGYYIPHENLLGQIDWNNSFIEYTQIWGLSGIVSPQRIPLTFPIKEGSTLALKNKTSIPLGDIKIFVDDGSRQLLYFNPVMISLR